MNRLGLRRREVQLLAACAALTGFFVSSVSQAQSTGDEFGEHNWRRDHIRYASPQAWAFEARIGPYIPNIDDEFGSLTPYKDLFTYDRRIMIGAEVDYQAFRIPYLGTIGPGAGIGYTRMSGKAIITNTVKRSEAEETKLWIMPVYAVGVLRVDVLSTELSIPFVPYGKAGFGYALWKTTNDRGDSKVAVGDKFVEGKGHSFGPHLAVGLMLQLDFLDQYSAQNLDNSVGINHAYIFGEWMVSKLGTEGQMRVGSSTWVTGLAFEI